MHTLDRRTFLAGALAAPAVMAMPNLRARAAELEQPSKVTLIPLENKDRTLSEGRGKMPYLDGLRTRFAYATRYDATNHPSLPNYLVWAAGNDFGISDDKPPKKHVLHGQTVWGNAIARGRTAKTYGDAQQGNNPATDQGQFYKVRHVAWPYFVDEKALADQFCVPMAGNLQADLNAGTMPNVSWIVGSTQHDAHSPSTAQDADAWLRTTVVPPLLASGDFTSGRLVVVISFDEGKDAKQNVTFCVLHASLDGAHLVVGDDLDHYDFWRSQVRYGGGTPSGVDALAAFGL